MISPVVDIVLPVANAVAVPDKVPVKLVAAKLVNPVTEVTVPPNVMVVEPKMVELFANLLFAIAVPLQTPEVIVPTVARFGNEVNVVFDVAVMLPAVVAVVAFPDTFPVMLPVTLPDKFPIKLGAVKSLLNVFAPAIVWAPIETNPGFVPLAADKVNELPLMVPPDA